MLNYPDIDPVAIAIGPLKVHWYGIMYIIAIGSAWMLARMRSERIGLNNEQIDDLIFYSAFGVILGGRIGYIIFYNFDIWIQDPLLILRVWEGGMSFHGGFLGVILAGLIYAKIHKKNFLELFDFVVPLVPIGLGAGRVGNFINAELWGKVSTAPWAMIFPGAGSLPRHPSMLYEAFLEGFVLFVLVWWYSSKNRPRMAISGLFIFLYGLFRFIVEFFRVPDAHLGYLAFDWITMGQILSTPMILIGGLLVVFAYTNKSLKES